MPKTMFPNSGPRILDFPEADFWPASSRVCSGHNFRLARHLGTIVPLPLVDAVCQISP